MSAARASADAARLPLMLTDLRLPTIKRLWTDLAAQSDREGWRAERLLSALFEHEMAERETRRLARRRAESDLPVLRKYWIRDELTSLRDLRRAVA